MEHAGRIVLHLGLLEVKVFGLVVGDAHLQVVVGVGVAGATRAAARRPVDKWLLQWAPVVGWC